jgi:hypothetical protein
MDWAFVKEKIFPILEKTCGRLKKVFRCHSYFMKIVIYFLINAEQDGLNNVIVMTSGWSMFLIPISQQRLINILLALASQWFEYLQ